MDRTEEEIMCRDDENGESDEVPNKTGEIAFVVGFHPFLETREDPMEKEEVQPSEIEAIHDAEQNLRVFSGHGK